MNLNKIHNAKTQNEEIYMLADKFNTVQVYTCSNQTSDD